MKELATNHADSVLFVANSFILVITLKKTLLFILNRYKDGRGQTPGCYLVKCNTMKAKRFESTWHSVLPPQSKLKSEVN